MFQRGSSQRCSQFCRSADISFSSRRNPVEISLPTPSWDKWKLSQCESNLGVVKWRTALWKGEEERKVRKEWKEDVSMWCCWCSRRTGQKKNEFEMEGQRYRYTYSYTLIKSQPDSQTDRHTHHTHTPTHPPTPHTHAPTTLTHTPHSDNRCGTYFKSGQRES